MKAAAHARSCTRSSILRCANPSAPSSNAWPPMSKCCAACRACWLQPVCTTGRRFTTMSTHLDSMPIFQVSRSLASRHALRCKTGPGTKPACADQVLRATPSTPSARVTSSPRLSSASRMSHPSAHRSAMTSGPTRCGAWQWKNRVIPAWPPLLARCNWRSMHPFKRRRASSCTCRFLPTTSRTRRWRSGAPT